uniref:hypothetical protein n=1 Tax=Orrella sp. TaxID=1921583 RepID=UPI0040559A3B
MKLRDLIRKNDSQAVATATPATFATDAHKELANVATVATVAVANPQEQNSPPLNASEEMAIRAWLKRIQEDDPVVIDEVIEKCRLNPADLSYFLKQAMR